VSHPDSEEALENATLALLGHLGWETVNCFDEVFGPTPSAPGRPNLGRENTGEVVLIPRLRAALQRLNPALPFEALRQAIDELTRDRRLLSPAAANRELYQLLKDGVRVTVREGE
jgi:type I restriction enzyme R subunit